MKTLTQTIYTLLFALALFISGSFISDAASMGGGQFDPNPAGGSTQFLSIKSGNACSNCANQQNSVSVDIDNPGDTDRFTVYMDFRNKGNATIYNAKGKMMMPSSGGTISGTLSGQGASSITDTAFLTNLPNNYEINFVSGYVENTHGTTDPQACAGYNQHFSITGSQVLGNGAPIGDLDTVYDGWCDQGYVIATFEIENTGTIIINPDLEVRTNNATNITTNSARLNGEVVEGENAQVWFAFSSSNNPNCSTQSQQVNVGGTYDAGEDFYATKGGLQQNTTYYFRACGRDQIGGDIKSGTVKNFTTEQTTTNYTYEWEIGNWGSCINGQQYREVTCLRYPGGVEVSDSFCPQPKPATQRSCTIGGGNDLEVETLGATNIGSTYATLNGRVTEGETEYVFFVYSQQYLSLNCNSTSNRVFPSDFNSPREAGDNFEYIFPSGSLQSETEYHYRACAAPTGVIGNPGLAQGDDVRFMTDDNGGPIGSPQAETQEADDEDEDSAELNGRIKMNDINDGIVFFVYGQDESQIDNTENDYDSYDEVENNEDEDEFMVVLVDDNNDDDGWRSYSKRVNDLEEDSEYFFQICVEYENSYGNEILECGSTEDFDTDDDNGGSNNDDDIEIRTDNPRSVTQTTAEMCGTLIDDGGENRVTYLEFRQTNGGYFTQTPERQRDEGQFCERVSGLLPATSYSYRACAEGECASERTFRTAGAVIQQNIGPRVTTQVATDIRSNYALLRGVYVANADRATVWFNYGRTQGLGSETRRQNVSGAYGEFTHPFTNLAANTTYYYQAAIQTVNGFDAGAIYSFRTNGGGVIISQPPVIVVQDDDTDIDLSSLGLGLSLIRLDIDDQEEVIVRDEQLTYEVEWENISQLDLFDLNLKVVFPEEIQVTNVSRGRFDQKTNTLYYTIDELLPGEQDRLSINAVVGPGTIGTLITAEAEIAYDNPVNDAQENAKDFDLDEYGAQFAGVTASIFGLGNITFLGWLVILLGLFIIFLIARWLYLEREEMRAQAYASGYRPYVAGPGYDAYGQPIAQMPVYQQPRYDVPPAAPAAPQNDYYEPYRPNRG